MPPALDRLLTSPSALRLLRVAINALEPPTTYPGSSQCYICRTFSRRAYKAPRRKATPLLSGTPLLTWETFKQLPQKRDAFDLRLPNGKKPHDARTWAQCLQEKARVESWDGIRLVWNARDGVFDLPTSDTPDAEYLWATFFKVPDLVLPVILHAAEVRKKSGQLHPRLYELCMSWWLPQDRYIDQVPHYHHYFFHHLQLRKLPLQSLARNGKQSFTPRSYAALMDIYRTSNERDVYDEVVPALCARGSVILARQWHKLCTRRGDYPSPQVAAAPLIRKLTPGISHITDPEARLVQQYASSMGNINFKLNNDLLRRLQGRDTAPVRFDDSLCAKLFATRSFPLRSVIKGLAIVGVNEIGPLAVRAMATSADSGPEIKHSFEVLKASGIELEGRTFSLALEKFALEERWHLVESMLRSDQHVDVYDDADIQKELLTYYLEQQDWEQVHRTLAIMSVFHNDISEHSWNLLLEAQATLFKPDGIMHTLERMRDERVEVSAPSMLAIKTMLRFRRRARQPRKTTGAPFDDLRFVTRVLFFIAENEMGLVSPFMWRELLRRYGMTGRLREFRRVLHLLIDFYEAKPVEGGIARSRYFESAAAVAKDKPTDWRMPKTVHQSLLTPLRILIPPPLQQAIVIWGFRHGLSENPPWEQSLLSGAAAKKRWRFKLQHVGVLRRLDWSFGLRTLVELRERGLKVHHHTVAHALQMVFINLFGNSRSRIKANNRMARTNNIWYSMYVRQVNEIWGEKLFSEPKEFGKCKIKDLAWHPGISRQLMNQMDYHLEGLIYANPDDKLDEEEVELPEEDDELPETLDHWNRKAYE